MSRFERLAGTHRVATGIALIAAPAAVAGLLIGVLPAAGSTPGAALDLTVSTTSCAKEWTTGHVGTQTFNVRNTSGKTGEVNLDNASGAVVAEIEILGPGTTVPLSATLGPGNYTFHCSLSGQDVLSSAPVQVTGTSTESSVVAVTPVTVADLTPANTAYQAYAARQLNTLTAQLSAVESDLQRSDIAAARVDWLAAQMTWETVGASYDSFGDLGVAVDGLPDGLPDGVDDKDFTGLHRLEYGLWHHQTPAQLLPVVRTLRTDVAAVEANLASDDIAGDPTNLPLRAHEILEDALRDHLSGIDDLGGNAAYPETYADAQATEAVLTELKPLVTTRGAPDLPSIAASQLSALKTALLTTQIDGQWQAPSAVPLAKRQAVDAAIGALLETLSSVPDLLEVPPSG